eukprot:TRINITY_DN52032_c0_g2_i1.p1 TRINITY_DN52032_c0_g2~~TRINITY_DN52032_c0_g2_i1.p1  ORF type:complete len:366 (+),score=33.13 TRINITY_DN52032_c0_g2_i1:40-1137(+)
MQSFKGCNNFRHILICATLSGTEVEIEDIRTMHLPPGIKDFEANFLKLLDRLTNQMAVTINRTGTVVKYTPGSLVGGTFTHECNPQRSMGYYLEALACLCPWAKQPSVITLRGTTNKRDDLGVDYFRTVTIPLLREFGISAVLQIKKRGSAPGGGGEVILTVEPVRKLQPVQLLKVGKIKKVRGIAYTAGVSPDLGRRLLGAAKGVFLQWIPNVFVINDNFPGKNSGPTPGYGMTIIAESTEKIWKGTEVVADNPDLSAEDVGKQAGWTLMEQLVQGGVIDVHLQPLTLLMMSLGPEMLMRVSMPALTDRAKEMAKLIEKMIGITFSVKKADVMEGQEEMWEGETPSCVVSCIGTDYINTIKRSN